MENGNTSKYLKYAVGEIFLVVIGILIALQVNNWNEQRLTNKKVHQYLIQIQNEMLNDLESFRGLALYLEKKDSLLEKVITNQITREDYQKTPGLRYAITNTAYRTLNNDGFNSLLAIIDESTFSNTKVLNDLKKLYINGVNTINQSNDWLNDFVHNYNNQNANRYPWASTRDPIINHLSEEEISYFVDGDTYKNQVMRYRNLAIGNVLQMAQFTEVFIAELYRDISEITKKEIPPLVNDYLNSPIDQIDSSRLGRYTSLKDDSSIELVVQNDTLKAITSVIGTQTVVNGRDGRYFLKEDKSNFVFENDSTILVKNYSRLRFVKRKD